MNTITGINSFKSKDKSKGKWIRWSLIIVCGLFFYACTSRQQAPYNEMEAKSDVKVSSPILQPTSDQLSFQGVTRYMQANDIRAQITGIVEKVNCTLAENITVHQALFIVQPQEAAALQKSNLSAEIKNGFSDTIYSHISGQIKSLNVQVGDFVQAGDILASCVRASSLKIIVYIPVEQLSVIEKTKYCKVILPDGTFVEGTVSGKLPVAEAQNQTQAYIVEPRKNIALAENINLTVQFITQQIQNAIMVPGGAVMGNEEQTNFWIMKLINDSTCIKMPVQKGKDVDSLVQLIGSDLTPNDLVVSEGAYGLPDSARVHVINKR